MKNYFPVSNKSFYDYYPSYNHRTGDIWRDLPTFGMLKRKSVPGIVITPACDLANSKCETITYLPIVSAAEYLCSESFRYECWNEIYPLLSRLPEFSPVTVPDRYGLPPDEILGVYSRAQFDKNGVKLHDAEKKRIAGYRQYVSESRAGTVAFSALKKFIKSDDMQTYLSRLVTNAFKADVHFLPRDGQASEISAIKTHSLVLFRYPLTIPIKVLDLALSTESTQWTQAADCKSSEFPVLQHMPIWPIKILSLQGGFLSDLISRYVNMYIRLGSEDFSKGAVRVITKEIGV